MENPEGQKRIKEYLDIFLKQKYNRLNENQVVYNSEESPNLETDNSSYPDPYAQNSEEELPETTDETMDNIEEVPYIYEPDPYLNDDSYETYPNLYDTENKVYPNPYEKIPNDPNDVVTYTNEGVIPY